jgi:hypothetical protein
MPGALLALDMGVGKSKSKCGLNLQLPFPPHPARRAPQLSLMASGPTNSRHTPGVSAS